jgi:protease-4
MPTAGHLQHVPYSAHWFGLWLMDSPAFAGLVQRVEQLNLAAHLESVRQSRGAGERTAAGVTIKDGIAIIPISGTLMKHEPSVGDATSTVIARKQIRDAVANDSVRQILLHVESPGGTAAGTMELGQEIAAARDKKPTWAFIEDFGASAAYWIASQADRILANEFAMVGSIGTYGVVLDSSGAAEKQGVKVHVLRAGEMKGMATPGTAITEEQLAELQRMIDSANGFFLRAVAEGRRMTMDRVQSLADGRIHRASDALKLQLIDGIATFEQTLASLAATTGVSQPARPIATSAPAPRAASRPATLAELRTELPGVDNDFCCQLLEERATIDQARGAWMAELQARLEGVNTESSRLRHGSFASRSPAASEPDPVDEFEQAVAAKMQAGFDRREAVRQVCRAQPDLYQSYIAAYNAQHCRGAGRPV